MSVEVVQVLRPDHHFFSQWYVCRAGPEGRPEYLWPDGSWRSCCWARDKEGEPIHAYRRTREEAESAARNLKESPTG